MNYKPGLGAAGIGGIIGATVLPQTGVGFTNDLAIAVFAALVVWGIMYLKFRKN
ncbi:MAG: LPXTG cell wall anchor domain-containing protein [Candidatus Saccharimonadia bacterium]